MEALMLPLNWQRVRLGDICEIVKGQQINKISLNNTDKYPVINGGIDFLGYTNKFNVSKNTIAISEGGTCGYVRFMKSDFWSGGHNYSLQKISNKVNNLCLYHILKSYEKDIMKLGVGSGLKNIQLKALKDFEIPLPPLNEQIAIANILSALDRYLCALRALILKKEGVKKALSFELLSQRKRLKGFNQAWQRVRLGDICEVKRGVRITKNELDVFGKYPVVSGGVGFLGYTNNFNRYENTITIAQYGTAGYVNFQKNKFWANDVCFCIYPNKDIIKNIFLYYFLKVNQNYLYEISNRNATPYSISKDKILDFEIPLPPPKRTNRYR